MTRFALVVIEIVTAFWLAKAASWTSIKFLAVDTFHTPSVPLRLLLHSGLFKTQSQIPGQLRNPLPAAFATWPSLLAIQVIAYQTINQ